MGVDHTTVSKHESGLLPLSEDNIKRYAQLYKVETHELFMEAEA